MGFYCMFYCVLDTQKCFDKWQKSSEAQKHEATLSVSNILLSVSKSLKVSKTQYTMVMAIVYCFEDMGFYTLVYWFPDMKNCFDTREKTSETRSKDKCLWYFV